jgi:dTDP-4-dehydrorhamnose 3,5-epimerase
VTCRDEADVERTMIFAETRIRGAFQIGLEPCEDERGFFARAYCEREFAEHGLNARVAQCNLSRNRLAGTLRGMHYSLPPHAESKLVRCTRGRIYDVLVDLRLESPTHRQWIAVELSADDQRMLYVPAGVAHGFQTLEANTDVFYQMSDVFVPESARGVRWNDPAFGIEWPAEPNLISARDRAFEDYPA